MVDSDDEAEFLCRRPGATVNRVADAGHCVQTEQPLELAALLDDFIRQLPQTPMSAGTQLRGEKSDER